MFTLLKTATVVAVLGLAAPAQARPFNISITMDSYRGQEAYLAAYIVDANGQYVSTVLTAGTRSRYLADLSRWNRMVQHRVWSVDPHPDRCPRRFAERRIYAAHRNRGRGQALPT